MFLDDLSISVSGVLKSPAITTFFFFFNVYLFLRDTETTQEGEGQRDRETDNPDQVPCCQPDVGLKTTKPRGHDLSRNQELDALSD